MTSAYGAAALAAEIAKLRAATEGVRNTTLNEVWFKVTQLIAAGHVDRDDAHRQVRDTALDIGLGVAETDRTMASAERGGTTKPRATTPPDPADIPTSTPTATRGPKPPAAAPPRPIGLPAAFWEAREPLRQIRQAAWSRGRSAEAVLGAVLARIAADTPHAVKLPPTVGTSCGLSLIVALTGPPGTGKSSSKAIACELVPPEVIPHECDDVSPGSGEGLLETMFEWEWEEDQDGAKRKVKRLRRHNVFVYADEGEILAVQARRTSTNTILPVIRSVFTDAALGQANAAEERKRRIPAGHYAFGIVLGIQPGKVGPLLDDAGGGTPQRFLWMPTDTPVPPPGDRPGWPDDPLPRAEIAWGRHADTTYSGWVQMEIAPEIADEVAANDHDRQQHGCSPLDEHADLVRLKVAGVLAVLDGRLEITYDETGTQPGGDWQLAGVIREVSNETRDRAIAVVAREQTEANRRRGEAEAERAKIVEGETRDAELARACRAIMRKLDRVGDTGARLKEIGDPLGKDRPLRDAALERLVDDGLIIGKPDGEGRYQTTRYWRVNGHG